MPIKKNWVSWEELEQFKSGAWTPLPHTHIKVDITDTPWAWADVLKTGSNLTDLATRQHAGLTNITSGQHHPQLHASAHHLGGGDAIKLDNLATPDDNVDLNVSISRHGLFPKLINDNQKFFNGVGQWEKLIGSSGIAIFILSEPAATTRNTNNDVQTTVNLVWTKLKETQLGEPTGKMRIYFEMKTSSATNVRGRIYKNGLAIGTERTWVGTDYGSWTDDLGGFDSGDLIQIYALCDVEDETVFVRNLWFQYNRAITHFGDFETITPIAIVPNFPADAFIMQNQDP